MSEKPRDFELALEVRDYECDLQGIVNNAVYLNYLEHARHQCLQSLGFSFADFHQQGYDLVLVRAELDYKAPLRSGDRFIVTVRWERASRLRFRFVQDIYKQPDGTHILHGHLIGTSLDRRRRPSFPPELEAFLAAR